MPLYKVNGVKKDGLQKYNVRVNYISNDGTARQLTRIAYGLEAANDLEMKLKAEVKGNNGEAPVKKMTLQQLFDEYMTVQQHEVRDVSLDNSRRTIENHILPMFKTVRIDRLNVQILQDWKLSMEEKGLALRSKKNTFDKFKAMLNYAVKMEYISKNHLMTIGTFKDVTSVKREMSYYTADEFKQFISTAKQIAQDSENTLGTLSEWDYYVFFNIAFYCGLRKGEIYALKWSDIQGSHLSVKRSISQNVRVKGKAKSEDKETPPKNKSSFRTLQMPLPLIRILNEHKARQQEHLNHFTDDYRVCGGEACIRDGNVGSRNKRYSETAGLKRIRLHDYRHSHVSILANERINIQEIARRLGHSKIEMTWNTYSHMYPREEERAVDILNMIA